MRLPAPDLPTRALTLLALAALALAWAAWRLTDAGDGVTVDLRSPLAALERWQESAARYPDNGHVQAQLGLAYLEQARVSGEFALYAQAEAALAAAQEQDPDQADALIGQGLLALARHDFQAALAWGRRARAAYPWRVDALGIMVDAAIELGQYEEAMRLLQTMVEARPGHAAYSRVSYLRELHGDVDGAIAAMAMAAAAAPAGEDSAVWARTQLGHLYFHSGRYAAAAASYAAALAGRDDYPAALMGAARVQAAQGDLGSAIGGLESLLATQPLPEAAVLLGDLYAFHGRPAQAARAYDRVPALLLVERDAGIDVALEQALFEADYGDPAAALTLAQAGYRRRPTVHAADVLAWALYRHGEADAAARYSREALRLGSRDATMHYHAGMIALARGEGAAARRHLVQALAINPAFSPVQAATARQALAGLGTPEP